MSRGPRRAGVILGATLVASMLAGPAPGLAGQRPPTLPNPTLTADLDGVPIDLRSVGDHFCHDFAYPQIHCFSKSASLAQAVQPILAASGVTYVIGFDYTSFQGPYMYFSQDYTVLATIGWNDRISSFVGQSSQSGRFWTDWFYLGTSYTFCCNQQVPSLGSYDNSFSSVYRV